MIVGLTGGIGSGKSTVAKMFLQLGVPVYFADLEAKKLMNTSPDLRKGIVELFGEMAYKNDQLNTSFIAEIVFKNSEKLQKLNELVHPAVKEDFQNWVNLQVTPYVIQENPLIFEKKAEDDFDMVITVTAPLDSRIERVMKRDGFTKRQVLDRMSSQMDDQLKIEGADFVIYNEILEKTRVQTSEVHNQILTLIP